MESQHLALVKERCQDQTLERQNAHVDIRRSKTSQEGCEGECGLHIVLTVTDRMGEEAVMSAEGRRCRGECGVSGEEI